MIGDCILSRVEGSVRSRTMEVRSGALLGQCSGEEEGLAEDGLCFLGMTGEVAFPMRISTRTKPPAGTYRTLRHWSRARLSRRAARRARAQAPCANYWRKPAGDASEADARCR